MIRIKLFSRLHSDVSEMKAKGWDIALYKDTTSPEGFVEHCVVSRGDVRFEIKRRGKYIEVKRFVDGDCLDTKTYAADGVEGCEGTLYINENNREATKTYCFFRNSELQCLLDSAGVEKMSFRGEGETSFEIMSRSEDEYIRTDGVKEGAYLYKGCTYFLDKKTSDLFIMRDTDLNELADKIL